MSTVICPVCKGLKMVSLPQTSHVNKYGENEVTVIVGGCANCKASGEIDDAGFDFQEYVVDYEVSPEELE